MHRVPCLTTAAAAAAAAEGMADWAAAPTCGCARCRSTTRPGHDRRRRRRRRQVTAVRLLPSRRPIARSGRAVDLAVTIGSVALPNPVMTASGTAGHGAELAPYLDLAAPRRGGGEVAARRPVAGQPGAAGPRDRRRDAQQRRPPGPRRRGLAGRRPAGAAGHRRPGRGVDLGPHGRRLPPRRPTCWPTRPPAWSPSRSTCRAPTPRPGATCSPTRPRRPAEVVAATAGCGRPRWAKLSPNVADLVEVAGAAHEAGAEAVTLVNTVMGMAIDPETRASGSARARGAAGCRARPSTRSPCGRCTTSTPRCPTLPIVGVGGVASGADAVELLLAGATGGAGGHGDLRRSAGARPGAGRAGDGGAGARACRASGS